MLGFGDMYTPLWSIHLGYLYESNILFIECLLASFIIAEQMNMELFSKLWIENGENNISWTVF